MPPSVKNIQKELRAVGFKTDELLSEGEKFCREHQIDVDDFTCNWEAYSIEKDIEKPTPLHLKNFKNYLTKENEKKRKRTSRQFKRTSDIKYVDMDKSSLTDFTSPTGKFNRQTSAYATPDLKRTMSRFQNSPSFASPASQIPFKDRKNAARVEFIFNDKIKLNYVNQARKEPLNIEVFANAQIESYRYMFEKLQEKAEELDIREDLLGQVLCKRFKLEPSDNVTTARQDVITAIGRVCCDAEGRLNDKSIMIEPAKDVSGGRRIQLDLKEMPSFSLFPGQIVAVEGVNGTGTSILASKIHQDARRVFVTNAIEELKTYADEPPLNIVIASGPYTAHDSMAYEPLDALLEVVSKDPPDVLLLIGPFINDDHPSIVECSVDRSFTQIFEDCILKRIESLLSKTEKLEIVILPGLGDVHHDYIFPQPPFEDKLKNTRVKFYPNPCTITINEISIGCTATDILFHMGAEEVSRTEKGAPPSDRLGRLTNHLIEQRSYYPLYPGSIDVNLNPKKLEQIEMPCTPDILILPSNMKYFAKNVNECLAVNPGHLTRAFASGTFARINVNSVRGSDLAGKAGKMRNSLANRAKVEIIRI